MGSSPVYSQRTSSSKTAARTRRRRSGGSARSENSASRGGGRSAAGGGGAPKRELNASMAKRRGARLEHTRWSANGVRPHTTAAASAFDSSSRRIAPASAAEPGECSRASVICAPAAVADAVAAEGFDGSGARLMWRDPCPVRRRTPPECGSRPSVVTTAECSTRLAGSQPSGRSTGRGDASRAPPRQRRRRRQSPADPTGVAEAPATTAARRAVVGGERRLSQEHKGVVIAAARHAPASSRALRRAEGVARRGDHRGPRRQSAKLIASRSGAAECCWPHAI